MQNTERNFAVTVPGPPKWEVRESLGKQVQCGAYSPHRDKGRRAGGVREDQSHMIVPGSETQLWNPSLGEGQLMWSFNYLEF